MGDQSLHMSLFSTAIGWMALAGRAEKVHSLVIACASEREAWERWQNLFGSRWAATQTNHTGAPVQKDWFPRARRVLADYVAGGLVDLSDIECDFSDRSEFERRVLFAVRDIPRGETRTYGQIATQVGSPQAARAVGGVMARNRVPLLIPCHRVVGTKGGLTGFSAPRGVLLKRELLDLEQGMLTPFPMLTTAPL